MAKALTSRNVLAHRLAQARAETGLSQTRLGIEAGMDDGVASVSINRYERELSIPQIHMMERIGKVTNHPLAWFYCTDDALAEVILAFYRGKATRRRAIKKAAAE